MEDEDKRRYSMSVREAGRLWRTEESGLYTFDGFQAAAEPFPGENAGVQVSDNGRNVDFRGRKSPLNNAAPHDRVALPGGGLRRTVFGNDSMEFETQGWRAEESALQGTPAGEILLPGENLLADDGLNRETRFSSTELERGLCPMDLEYSLNDYQAERGSSHDRPSLLEGGFHGQFGSQRGMDLDSRTCEDASVFLRDSRSVDDGQNSPMINPLEQSYSPLTGMRRFQTSPPVKAKKIFKLMEIRNDSQDLSFVEKVILSQEEIIKLCNEIHGESAKASDGRSFINFELLNREFKKVVGFFGSKDVMRNTFMEADIAEQREVWIQMQNDTLPAGLYVWYRRDSLFVFYWHQGNSLPEATRKDMSCNFVRYVFDLCETVYVCVETKNLNNSLFASVPKFSKRQRTQRLQISLVKASEDSVKFRDGFILEQLQLDGNAVDRYKKGDVIASTGEFKLSDGHSRIALLTSFARPRKVSPKSRKDTVAVKAFAEVVSKWSKEFNIDVTNLSDEDFIVFLRCAGCKQWDDFSKLRETHDRRMRDEENQAFSVDDFVHNEEKLLLISVASYLDAFLMYKYPWEQESWKTLNSINPLSSSNADHSPQAESTAEKICADISSSSSIRRTVKAASAASSDPQRVEDRLKQLETDIYGCLVDKSSSQRLVFPTSEVHIKRALSETYIGGDHGERVVYTIEVVDGNQATKLAPLQYGKNGKNVILRRKGSESKSKVTSTRSCARDHCDSPTTCTATLYLNNARDYEGPVMTHEEIYVESDAKLPKVIKLELCRDDCNLRDWVNRFAQISIPSLWSKTALLSTVHAKLDNNSLRGWDENLIVNVLESDSPVDELQMLLPTPIHEFAQRLWADLHAGQKADFEHIVFEDSVKTLCMKVYGKCRQKLHSKVAATVRRSCSLLLDKKIRLQLSNNNAKLKATLKEEERMFLVSLKSDFWGKKDGALRLRVNACRFIGKSEKSDSIMGRLKSLIPFKSEDEEKLSISFTKEELEMESITWKALELAPMKEDLESLITDPERNFTPSCSDGKEVVDLDPKTQTLAKVIFLKGGQLLVFVLEVHGQTSERDLVLYLCPKLGVKLSASSQLRVIKRGFDLFAFDEQSRYIALYESGVSIIKIFRFDNSFRNMDWTGADVALGEYATIGRLIWMDFVSGKNEIVFIDEAHIVRLCEVSQPAMVRSGNVHLGPSRIVKACVSPNGCCLLVLRQVKTHLPESQHVSPENPSAEDADAEAQGMVECADQGEHILTVDVFRLSDTISPSNSFPFDITVKDSSKLQFAIVSFASQMHLVIHDSERPSVIVSKILKVSSASEVCQLQQISRPDSEAGEGVKQTLTQSGPVLDYVYQIFEKYATSPPLITESRDLYLRLLLKEHFGTLSRIAAAEDHLSQKCSEYVKSSILRLNRDKGKDFSSLRIHVTVDDGANVGSKLSLSHSDLSANSNASDLAVQMGNWIRKLVCLVPIQIARAENNSLKPMVDGLQLSSNADYVDAISLANVIRFGLYEAVLNSWAGPIKVISSMGKQSSGKSYLLNHLSGSLLDVAGGRCTDGVWMTVRHGSNCLYVLLDFEGLGSFERSEQEDMLLSILNAAVSNLTIFNKKDFHLDKETEAIFERFQNGVTLVKADAKLFNGLFYMAIKDVDSSDVEDLKKEFQTKISQICNKSRDNFLTKMYGGEVEISAMPSFNRPEFHESIGDIARTVEELAASYKSGRSFLMDLKLVIAQISTKDWSPIDVKRVALRVNLLKQHIHSATSVGCVIIDGTSKPLVQFDDQPEIPDGPLNLSDFSFPILDTGLELSPFRECKLTTDVLVSLLAIFRSSIPRNGQKDEEWHSSLEGFISALVSRRKERVLEWITKNTADFSDDGDIQKLKLETVALMAEVQQKLLLCSCKCERCFLRCVVEKGHPSNHSCNGNHMCAEMCTYCLEEEDTVGAIPCSDAAGHDGPHDCKEKSHTCGKCCSYAQVSSNCNADCSKKSGHAGDHQCNSKQHLCNKYCSLPSCKNPCVSPIDQGDHDVHFCHEKFCPAKCSISLCNRTCATQDHFHGLEVGVAHHFCGSDHPCPEKCEHEGNCEVLTEVSKKTQTFTGKRATFDYELVSEQNGNRKGCCIVIPAGQESHNGPHSHSTNADAVHFCETKCRSCGYFCNRPMGHGGLHNTTHGNMRDVTFVSESQEIDILDRKYSWGESGVAELCQMHCKARGRGHVHLIPCPLNGAGGTCRKIFDGTRHETRKYGPDFDVSKDEMTHEAFWQYIRFEDPCSVDEGKDYALCDHQCKSDEHISVGGSSVQKISYCTEKLWHAPIAKNDLSKFGAGYITDDGHHFSCDHSKNIATNVIFVVDSSGSMDTRDIRPMMAKFTSSHNNRLGCVYEAILRFIRTRVAAVQGDVVSVVLFDSSAYTVVKLQDMKENVVDLMLSHPASGGTTYSSGLQNAEQILLESLQDANIAVKSSVIVFLSDGGNNGGGDPLYYVRRMKAIDPKLQVHTIMFGNDPSKQILIDMAKAGDGTFEVSLDEIQLTRRFEGLAKSLRPKVASLM